MTTIKRIAAYLLILLTSFSAISFSDRQPADFPKAAVAAKTLLLTDVPADGSGLTLASMQGLLANVSDRNLLFHTGKYRDWLPLTGAELITAQPNGAPWDLDALIREFAPFLTATSCVMNPAPPSRFHWRIKKTALLCCPRLKRRRRLSGCP